MKAEHFVASYRSRVGAIWLTGLCLVARFPISHPLNISIPLALPFNVYSMNAPQQRPVIGITIGDLNGIGAELIIKAFSDHRLLEWCTPVIFASNKVINFTVNPYRIPISTIKA